MLLALRRRRRLGVASSPVLLAAALFSGLFGVLPWGLLGVAFPPAPLAPLAALGALGLALLATLPVLSVGLLYGVRRLRPWLAGMCFGVAGYAIVEAVWPTAAFGGMLAGPALVAVASLAALLGRQVAFARGRSDAMT